MAHVCPWWGGFFLDNPLRRILHKPEKILAPYVAPGMTALDFGCGMGLFAIAMAEMVQDQGRVIAADLQQKMLDVVRTRAQRAGVAERIRTHRCQPDSIGIDDPVDFVLAFWSVHEVPDMRRLLDELYAHTVRGGKLLVAEPRLHVSGRAFASMVEAAGQIGFRPAEEPRIRLSKAVVLVRQ